MKSLHKTILSFSIIFLLAPFSEPEIAQAQQGSIRSFSWEGLSLNMSPDRMVGTLKSDGYTQLRVTEGKKKVSIYQRKSEATNNKVQFTEKDGVLTKFSFSETRTGGKKNKLSNAETDATYARIKFELGIEDSTCKPGIKGGGTCNGQPTSATHTNGYNVNVTPKATKIVLSSRPMSQAVLESNKETTDGLASAYGCLGTTDIASVKEIYECINSVSEELEVLDKAKKINRSKHMPVYLNSTTIPCWQLSNFYKRGLSFLRNDSDTAPLPSCATFAAVIKHAAGSPAFWSGCMNEDESDEFLKSCIDGVNPSYFKLVDQRLPSCKDYQLAYQTGVVAAGDKAINVSAVSPPECEHVLAFAKSLRKPLTEELLACAGYDPDKAGEHILNCLTSDEDLWGLEACPHVQVSYRKKLVLSNYGYVPDTYVPIACDQTKDLIAKADSVRERLRAKEAEFQRQALLRREDKEYMKEYMKEKNRKDMEERYGDTPEKTATRTSKLEKEIKANGGNIKLACKALGRNNIYCPPTLEEIRLAMMRNHSKNLNMRMIDGHKIYGDLNASAHEMVSGSAMMIGMMSLPEVMKIKYLGVELLYGEPVLLRDCASRSASSYDCFFTLDLRDYKDKRTIQESGYTVSVSKQLRFIKRYDYSYYFSIGEDGLWHAERTGAQVEKDQVMIKKNQERMDYEDKVFQEDIKRTNDYIEGLR